MQVWANAAPENTVHALSCQRKAARKVWETVSLLDFSKTPGQYAAPPADRVRVSGRCCGPHCGRIHPAQLTVAGGEGAAGEHASQGHCGR